MLSFTLTLLTYVNITRHMWTPECTQMTPFCHKKLSNAQKLFRPQTGIIMIINRITNDNILKTPGFESNNTGWKLYQQF